MQENDPQSNVIGAIESLCDVGYAGGGFNVLLIGEPPHFLIVISNGKGESLEFSAPTIETFLTSLKGQLGETRFSPAQLWEKIDSFQQ